jgi:thiamine-phosphate pyrophosphorylase
MPIELADAGRLLSTALAAGPVACVLLVSIGEEAADVAAVRPLVKLAQARGAAALLLDDVALAKAAGADGVHLDANPYDYDDARRALGPKAIVGARVGTSRHDAMEIGERGADYIAFSGPADDEADAPLAADNDDEDVDPGDDLAAADDDDVLFELIGWWADIFTVPCVAWDVASPEQAAELAETGADFIAIAPEAWLGARDPGVVVEAFARAIGQSAKSA